MLFSFKTPIEVEVHGDDLPQLKRTADEVQAVMESLPELADVETTLHSGAPEVQIVYDRDRLSRYGLNVREVARLVRDKVQGHEATRFNLHDRRIPIVARLELADRETVEDVRVDRRQPGRGTTDLAGRGGRGHARRGAERGAAHRRPARRRSWAPTSTTAR